MHKGGVQTATRWGLSETTWGLAEGDWYQRRKESVGRREGNVEALQMAKTRVHHPVDFHLKGFLTDGFPRCIQTLKVLCRSIKPVKMKSFRFSVDFHSPQAFTKKVRPL